MPNKPSQGYVKKSISFHPDTLEEIKAAMADDCIDNLSGFIQQLVRKELRKRQNARLREEGADYGSPAPKNPPKKKTTSK